MDTQTKSEVKVEPKDKGKIVIRALSKSQLACKISPLEDRTGKLFTGQGKTGFYEGMTPAERAELAYLIDRNTILSIDNDTVFNLNDDIDAANWAWAQRHPYIAPNRKAAEASRDARFYVYSVEAEAKAEARTRKPVVKAEYMIYFEASQSDLVDAAASLGHPAPQALNMETLQKWFKDFVNDSDDTLGAKATLVIDTLNPKNKKHSSARKLYHELLRANVIAKHRGGVFRYGGENGIFLGRNETEVVDYILSDENKETVTALKTSLQDAKDAVEL